MSGEGWNGDGFRTALQAALANLQLWGSALQAAAANLQQWGQFLGVQVPGCRPLMLWRACFQSLVYLQLVLVHHTLARFGFLVGAGTKAGVLSSQHRVPAVGLSILEHIAETLSTKLSYSWKENFGTCACVHVGKTVMCCAVMCCAVLCVGDQSVFLFACAGCNVRMVTRQS